MVELFLIVVPALIVGTLCRVWKVMAPIPLVAVGGVIGLLPAVRRVHPDPDVLLSVVLPPLLFGAALSASYVGIRRNLAAIGALSIGLVVVTAAVVAGTAHVLEPAVPLAAMITLGAVLAPADSVATSAVARKVGMKRGTQRLLDGENLLNDGAALTIFNVAVSIVLVNAPTPVFATRVLVVSVLGGIVAGVVGGLAVRTAVERLDDAGAGSTLILITPYCLFFLAEMLGGSGFLAVVLAGLILSRGAGRGSFATRLQVLSLWSVLTFLMESVAFVLVGFELTSLLADGGVDLLRRSLPMFAAVLVAIVLTRVAWVMGLIAIPHLRRRANHGRPVALRDAAVVAWAGIRGPVSVFAALGIPLVLDDGSPWPMRDEFLLVTTCTVIATLLVQGTTLGPLMKRLRVTETGNLENERDDREAESAALAAAHRELDALLAAHPDLDPVVVQRLKTEASATMPALGETERTVYRSARVAMIDSARTVCFRYRAEGLISEESARRLIRRLDLQEATTDLE